MRIAILTCRRLPGFVTWEIPDMRALFADDRQLIAEFAALGVEAVSVAWDDAGVDWRQFELAIIRSTWDYIDERDRFLAVMAEIDTQSRLLNPLDAVRWNSDKSYLFDLAARGVPIVPTLAATRDQASAAQEATAARGWSRVVLKPRIGTGAAGVTLIESNQIAATLGRLTAVNPDQDFLLQPLIENVVGEGEWSFIFIDGAFSHALLKKPAPGDYRAHGIYGGFVEYATPARDDLLQAEAMLAKLPFDLLYARLDLVRVEGRLAIMEVELIEPMLYFDRALGSAGRLARTVLSKLSSPGNSQGLL